VGFGSLVFRSWPARFVTFWRRHCTMLNEMKDANLTGSAPERDGQLGSLVAVLVLPVSNILEAVPVTLFLIPPETKHDTEGTELPQSSQDW